MSLFLPHPYMLHLIADCGYGSVLCNGDSEVQSEVQFQKLSTDNVRFLLLLLGKSHILIHSV